ncbi:hypothetical protein [Streptomyces sp. ISL-100]|uniref:hypothetical protein n=1 Tax=Streptomyces sp. ISL-100 TaxID=2819173 RepID=UPI001BECBC89|nr:hypothetical protein [Streptomyces sp. ISL-100]MBT2400708.1 hypothetical protein [Streptomyces sp. ISL-100]
MGGLVGGKLSMADVPLGPFAGSLITVYSAKSKAANLHVSRRCGQLRTSDVRTVDVPLETTTMQRLCSRCAALGAWGRPTTALGIFLRALGGVGLLFELQSYTEADEEECWTDEEAGDAAALLRSEQDLDGDDDEGVEGGTSLAEAREDAERLRDLIFSHWRGAGRSLYRAQAVLAHFPWLQEWAKPSLTAKMRYLEMLRGQAARFVEPEELLVAASATTLPTPEFPCAEPAFAVLGSSSRVSVALVDLWRRWQSAAGRPWDRPGVRAYLSYEIVRDVRSNRKGYDAARATAARLIESWEEWARTAATSADRAPTRRLTVRVPEASEATARHDGRDFLDGLDMWTLGVLVTWTVDADWGSRVLTLEVPDLVAERLLDPTSDLSCSPVGGAADPPERDRDPEIQPGIVRPGVFDDTPVFDRRPVTLDHIRALRTLAPEADQLYLVFSASGGAEVLPLDTIERRLAKG